MGTLFAAGRLQPVLTNEPPVHHECTEKHATEPHQHWPLHSLFGYALPAKEQVQVSLKSLPARRNSAPSFTTKSTANVTMERRQSLVIEGPWLESEPVVDTTRPGEPTAETSDPSVFCGPLPVKCNICFEEIPGTDSSMHITGAIQPCINCSASFCRECIKIMFIGAAKDTTRMPPRCCEQIHLHHARADMTDAEVAEYKTRHDEWSAPRPFYCPMPTCSVFIPNRVLPHPPTKGNAAEKRTDSGTDTPSLIEFPCPTCATQICLECRQAAHPGATCAALDAGVDPRLIETLKKWGYMRCPKCLHGVKRMYGCSRMECRCGCQFCWNCRQSWVDCAGCEDHSFNESDDDAYMSDQGNDDADSDAGSEMAVDSAAENAVNEHTDGTEPNLDGRAALRWHNLDLGAEPTDDTKDQAWMCWHFIEPIALPMDDADMCRFALDMECVACWRNIHPAPEKPEDDDDSAAHAFECSTCALIVCTACRDGIVARQTEMLENRQADDGAQDGGSDDDDDEDEDKDDNNKNDKDDDTDTDDGDDWKRICFL